MQQPMTKLGRKTAALKTKLDAARCSSPADGRGTRLSPHRLVYKVMGDGPRGPSPLVSDRDPMRRVIELRNRRDKRAAIIGLGR